MDTRQIKQHIVIENFISVSDRTSQLLVDSLSNIVETMKWRV